MLKCCDLPQVKEAIVKEICHNLIHGWVLAYELRAQSSSAPSEHVLAEALATPHGS